jgi:ubiquinone/menaquinone biosynthesis C-methylase UbiE
LSDSEFERQTGFLMQTNSDAKTVEGFGEEWSKFDQSELDENERLQIFESYFKIFPWESLPKGAVGFDLGCGSGRWAKSVAPKVGKLICIDASRDALEVAERNLLSQTNCEFYNASVAEMPLANNSMDFGYSLGVLHHIPNPLEGIKQCTSKLKKGAPFLIYLYYAFDNRPAWFRLLWKISDIFRQGISKLPTAVKHSFAEIIALTVYFPLAKTAYLLEKIGLKVSAFPLSIYKDKSFYTMRTDALDRFGTRLEYRFTRRQIEEMLTDAGLEEIRFSDEMPFWCAVGVKKRV